MAKIKDKVILSYQRLTRFSVGYIDGVFTVGYIVGWFTNKLYERTGLPVGFKVLGRIFQIGILVGWLKGFCFCGFFGVG